MKRAISLLLFCLMLTGCGAKPSEPPVTVPTEAAITVPAEAETPAAPEYVSRFDSETQITLSDSGIVVDNATDESAVVMTHDIIYYQDQDTYASGNPYGEGASHQRHSAEEADAHTVVNITKPGAYRVTGTLSAGQIRVDLGEDAYRDPNAVVELILDNADITCSVAPAILFLNTYECDGSWSVETAQAEVDTTAAGANLILEGSNTVSGSHVAKIFKDAEGEKKLWKQDGAIYSYMSLNVFGPGALELNADNEGLDTQLHLTINGGNICIYSGNDGINTNEDGVSVTAVNGGNLTIYAGLGEEGDGIDSNGYLVINGGSVVACANPAADAGLDSDLGSFINGGTVIAMGSTMDWAESDSDQVTMNLQFAGQQKAGSTISVTQEDGTEIFSFASQSEHARSYSGLILSHAAFQQGQTYHVFIDGQQMAYTGNDVGPGIPGGRIPGGVAPEGMTPPEMPEGMVPPQMPDGMQPPEWSEGMEPPEGFDPTQTWGRAGPGSGNMTPPEGSDGQMPTMPEGEIPQMPEGGFGSGSNVGTEPGNARTDFYMNDKVNAFSGVTTA